MASRACPSGPSRSRRLRPCAVLLFLCLAGAARAAPLPLAELDRLALADEAGVAALEARALAARERAVENVVIRTAFCLCPEAVRRQEPQASSRCADAICTALTRIPNHRPRNRSRSDRTA